MHPKPFSASPAFCPRPAVAQQKPSVATFPMPPVYRPQQGSRPGSGTVVPPPVYHPQAAPVQRSTRISGAPPVYRPVAATETGGPRNIARPAAPPVFRPAAPVQTKATPHVGAPPVYRPERFLPVRNTVQRAVSIKALPKNDMIGRSTPTGPFKGPPVYKPSPVLLPKSLPGQAPRPAHFGPVVVQRMLKTQVSSGGGGGQDGDKDPPKKESPSPFAILDRVRGRWDAVFQFIQGNEARVLNVLNSAVGGYNGNWLMGAVLYQLLNTMLQQLDALWDAYWDEYDRGSDDMFDVETRDGGLSPAGLVLEQEHQDQDAYFQSRRTLLFELVSFFEEYQTVFTQNNHQNHAPQHLFDAAPPVHPDQGGTTVRQSMALEDLQLNLVILEAFNRKIPHPGGDRTGRGN